MAKHTSVKGLQRGELSRRTGCHLETIRYYENIGLMPTPPRSPKGYRLYDEAHARRLRFILRSRELGFGIDEIRGLLGLVDRKGQTCAEVRERTRPHLAEIRAKIGDLKRIERLLARTMAQCSGEEVPECPILDALAT
jgi:MerR family mercuric resistance operon transcriptional regulator